MDNAINYTPSTQDQPGVITARVFAENETGSVVLQVEDSGPGIGESERDLVFQPFYRTLGTDADGTGLGLAIVQEIARRHGADVRLGDTHPDRHPPGARFTVRFEARKDSGLAQAVDMASRSSPPTPSLGPLL